MEEHAESKLSAIDAKLENFAKKYGAKITSPNIQYFTKVPDSLENRLVEWIDGDISKTFMIRPYVDTSGVSATTWEVLILASLFKAPSFDKPFRLKYLATKVNLQALVQQMDQLLTQAQQTLDSLKPEDIK